MLLITTSTISQAATLFRTSTTVATEKLGFSSAICSSDLALRSRPNNTLWGFRLLFDDFDISVRAPIVSSSSLTAFNKDVLLTPMRLTSFLFDVLETHGLRGPVKAAPRREAKRLAAQEQDNSQARPIEVGGHAWLIARQSARERTEASLLAPPLPGWRPWSRLKSGAR